VTTKLNRKRAWGEREKGIKERKKPQTLALVPIKPAALGTLPSVPEMCCTFCLTVSIFHSRKIKQQQN